MGRSDAVDLGVVKASTRASATSIEELKLEGKYRVLTPEQALQSLQKTGSLHLAPLTGGCSPVYRVALSASL